MDECHHINYNNLFHLHHIHSKKLRLFKYSVPLMKVIFAREVSMPFLLAFANTLASKGYKIQHLTY